MNLGVQINLNLSWIKKKKQEWKIFDYNKLIDRRFTIIYIHWMKKMVCLITSIDFLSIQPFLRPLFSGQQELSKLDYFFQNGGKRGAQANRSFWKLNNIFWWSKISHIIIKGWNYMIKSFSGQIVFCFAILRAIFAYVGENWLSQYTNFSHIQSFLGPFLDITHSLSVRNSSEHTTMVDKSTQLPKQPDWQSFPAEFDIVWKIREIGFTCIREVTA